MGKGANGKRTVEIAKVYSGLLGHAHGWLEWAEEKLREAGNEEDAKKIVDFLEYSRFRCKKVVEEAKRLLYTEQAKSAAGCPKRGRA